VKVRGYRIELGEIEAALTALETVAHAVVVVRDDVRGDKQLVAYVARADGARVDVTAIRSELRRSLPEHMVPAAFVVLSALPTTGTGKIDRNALPAPDFGAAAAEYVAPRTPLEGTLATVLAKVLDLPNVGVHDDFFALGGHSLLVARAVAWLHDVNVSISIAQFFAGPSVAELARSVEEAAAVPVLVPVDRTQPLPLSWSQKFVWGYEQVHRGTTAWTVPFAFVLRGVDLDRTRQALRELFERHEILRSRVVLASGEPMMAVGTVPARR
jgi:hypothetical protein